MIPFLPPELERDIFELVVASSGTKCIPSLLLVARRVKLWLEPLLYRIALVGPARPERRTLEKSGNALLAADVLAAAIPRLPAAFLHTHVQHVFVDSRGYSFASRDTILAALTGATDLFLLNILDAPSLLANVRRMPLRRLQANLGSLFGGTRESPLVGRVDFGCALFAHLTHLAVFDNLGSADAGTTREWAGGLAALPALTHLSFEHDQVHPLFKEVLGGRVCAALCVFVVLVDPDSEQGPLKAELEQYERALVMDDHKTYEGEKDWYRGAQGLDDYWERAEELLKERKLGGRS
ncbi:hypothetical protein C8R46DRAFT_304961 [Mycena filopes]|nr:hypothetical protein C8R46DRAFT_304961 [Mycena filopes]